MMTTATAISEATSMCHWIHIRQRWPIVVCTHSLPATATANNEKKTAATHTREKKTHRKRNNKLWKQSMKERQRERSNKKKTIRKPSTAKKCCNTLINTRNSIHVRVCVTLWPIRDAFPCSSWRCTATDVSEPYQWRTASGTFHSFGFISLTETHGPHALSLSPSLASRVELDG